MTAADFNGDELDDLAIGSPWESHEAQHSGSVYVIHGSEQEGLSTIVLSNLRMRQGDNGVEDDEEVHDHFGRVLTVGDFNNDSFDDLVIGVPEEDLGSAQSAGCVHVIYGSNEGLGNDDVPIPTQYWTWDLLGYNGSPAGFGWSLTAGDFNDDGRDDLAVGTPFEDVLGVANAGAVYAIYGLNSYGLAIVGNQMWHQDSTDIENIREFDDRFGYSLAAGDFNNDSKEDLVIGVPYEDQDGFNNAGAFHAIYGSNNGLSATAVIADQFWHQNSTNIEDANEANDYFAFSLP
ncbi:hypothetical protein L0156_15030 [bacterium]|nr:hypothetical protein [bacterium]